MKIIEEKLKCYLLESSIIKDERGWFEVAFSSEKLADLHIDFGNVYQVNHSCTASLGVVRGPNYQSKPYNQAKVVRCIRGAVYSVAIDIDKESETFGQWCGYVLSSENKRLMYVPRTFAHGFVTLEDNTELEYLTDNIYDKHSAKSVAWNDPTLKIDWTMEGTIEVNTELMSEKNKNAPFLSEVIF